MVDVDILVFYGEAMLVRLAEKRIRIVRSFSQGIRVVKDAGEALGVFVEEMKTVSPMIAT